MNSVIAVRRRSAGRPAADRRPVSDHGRIDLEVRALTACTGIRDAWSALAARALEANPFWEPDFALAAAQHLVAFRHAGVILAWQGEPRRLVGLAPCHPRNRLFGVDALSGFCDPRIFNGAPLLDRDMAQPVLEAMLSLRQGVEAGGRGLLLREIDLAGPTVKAALRAGETLHLSATLRPPAHAIPLPVRAFDPDEIASLRQALARQGRITLVEAGARMAVRDAVEIVLAMEASGPGARAGLAILQDTREAGFLRAMTRSLALTRQCRVGLLMLGERPIAGAIVIGKAQRGWLYAETQDEAFAPFEPSRLLLALMRQAQPNRPILRRGGKPACGLDDAAIGELCLQPTVALRPRDIAARAGGALRRAGLRLAGIRLPDARAAG